MTTSPSVPSSIIDFIFRTAVIRRVICPVARTTPARSHASITLWASAMVVAIGFSTKTCFPARAAAAAWPLCWWLAEVTRTASMEGSASMVS